jgi:hypothetical protein
MILDEVISCDGLMIAVAVKYDKQKWGRLAIITVLILVAWMLGQDVHIEES